MRLSDIEFPSGLVDPATNPRNDLLALCHFSLNLRYMQAWTWNSKQHLNALISSHLNALISTLSSHHVASKPNASFADQTPITFLHFQLTSQTKHSKKTHNCSRLQVYFDRACRCALECRRVVTIKHSHSFHLLTEGSLVHPLNMGCCIHKHLLWITTKGWMRISELKKCTNPGSAISSEKFYRDIKRNAPRSSSTELAFSLVRVIRDQSLTHQPTSSCIVKN